MPKLYWETVAVKLKELLERLMKEPVFEPFRLVGGTALSLYLGHRQSVDIDLFTDAAYGAIDFDKIESYLSEHYPYVAISGKGNAGMGRGFLVGQSETDHVKLDVYYCSDAFLQPQLLQDDIRMATIDDIVAMKIDVVQGIARKKDFWDIHELLDSYSVIQMIELHAQRYEYTHDRPAIIENFTNFSKADMEPDPICSRGKHWEIIKTELVECSQRQKLSPNKSLMPKKAKAGKKNRLKR